METFQGVNTNYPLKKSFRSAPKLSCIEEFEEEENEENVDDLSSPARVRNSNSIGNAIHERLSTPLEEVEEEGEECTPPVISRVPGSPSTERKSCPEPVIEAQLGTRSVRPHTVPMDAKLNLPYLTGYDKVMHMLDMPCESRNGESHLLDDEDEEYSYPYVATNSDPVASSPSSDASESVVESEDEFGKQSQREDSGQEEDRLSDENEINDNVSDESGYSEEAAITAPHRNSQTVVPPPRKSRNVASKKESPCSKLNSSPKCSPGNDETTKISSTNSTNPPALVIYDNLCFEI